jgi:hypothetical protein
VLRSKPRASCKQSINVTAEGHSPPQIINFIYLFVYLLSGGLWIEARASYVLGKHPITELRLQPFVIFF